MNTYQGRVFSISLIIMLLYTATGCSVIDRIVSNKPNSTISLVTESVDESESVPVIDQLELTRSWIVPDGPKRTLRPLTWDLVHQKIWLEFNFDRSQVIGTTELLLTSKYEQDLIILDSITTEIHEIRDLTEGSRISFVKDSATVAIPLNVNYLEGDTIIIRISYTATPPNRGLYFVNSTGSDPEKPRQIWTLGQPEDNSFWLPTLDHPAERTTTEMWISVPDNFTTISNGALIRSEIRPNDSIRTDYWIMDKPHAPYLIALAAGEYVSTEQLHMDVLLKYFAEPQFENSLRSIYRDTDKMLKYFTDMLDYPYPWDTYAQVPVRDFIARGMENTTATILFEHVQVTERQSKDVNHQDLLVHELIHQWFGNLVTSKDWANLPLNEGFAKYFEILFRNHHQGFEHAQLKVNDDRQAYFQEAQIYRRPIIFDRYNEPEDMYDRHTYEKASLVLRMLHHEVGDEVWWKALNTYLNRHAWSAVDWEDLNKVFNEVSGRNLDHFFEQWFLKAGHPELSVEYIYSANWPNVRIQQHQDLEITGLFKIPVDIYYSDIIGNQYIVRPMISSIDTIITINLPIDSISTLEIDPYRVILASIDEDVNVFQLISRLAHPSPIVRYESIQSLRAYIQNDQSLVDIFIEAFHFENVPEIRYLLLESIAPYLTDAHLSFVHSLDEDSEEYFRIRILAADISRSLTGIVGNKFLEKLSSDKSYYVEKHIHSIIK